jgi:hypothetical protein
MEPGVLVAFSQETPFDRILCHVMKFSKGNLLGVTEVRTIN